MSYKIQFKNPPNIEQINQVLKVKGNPNIIFTYGNTIYAPGLKEEGDLSPDLVEHEKVHMVQQEAIGGPEIWWEKYLVDKAFRLSEELVAYKVQLDYIKQNMSREKRRFFENYVPTVLASEMYGKIITKKQAKKLLES